MANAVFNPNAKRPRFKEDGTLNEKVPSLTVNKGGRPAKLIPNQKTLDEVRLIASYQSTTREAAARFRVSHQTFLKFKNENPAVLGAWEQGQQEGLFSLRVSQFRLARTNATMAIHLGVNMLGQKVKQEIVNTVSGTIDVRVHRSRDDVIREMQERGLPTRIYDQITTIDLEPDEYNEVANAAPNGNDTDTE